MKFIRFIVLLLVIIGALNWGLWGFFQYDLVADIFGGNTTGWARFVYAIIGICGIYAIFDICKCRCKKSGECGSKREDN